MFEEMLFLGLGESSRHVQLLRRLILASIMEEENKNTKSD